MSSSFFKTSSSSSYLNSTNYSRIIFQIEGPYGATLRRRKNTTTNVSGNNENNEREGPEKGSLENQNLEKKMLNYLRLTTYLLGALIILFLVASSLYAGFATCDANPYQVEIGITETTVSSLTPSYYTLNSKSLVIYPLWYFAIGFGFLCVLIIGFPFLVYISILINYDENPDKNVSMRDNVLYKKDGDFYFWITDAFLGIAVYGITGQFIGIVEVFTLYCLVFLRFISSLVGGFLHEYFNLSIIPNDNEPKKSNRGNWMFLIFAYLISFLLMGAILFTHMTYFDQSTTSSPNRDNNTVSLLTLQWILISLILFFDLIKGLLMVFKYSTFMNERNMELSSQVDRQNVFNFLKILVQQLQYLSLVIILLIHVLLY